MKLHFNLTLTGVVSHDPEEADAALSKADLLSNLDNLIATGMYNGLITGGSSSVLDEYDVTKFVTEAETDLFPSYKQYKKDSEFLAAFIAACNSMLQVDATGGIMTIQHRIGVKFMPIESLTKLLDNPDLYPQLCNYEMILFDGGNVHGDSWKNVFYPNQMIQTFVLETE